MKSPLGVAILGAGNIANGYADDLVRYDHLKLVGVADLDPERAKALALKHGVKAYGSTEELLADPEVDVVANLTIHHAHFETTSQILNAGKHVHSEKPIALSSKEAWALVALAEERGVRLGSSPFMWMGNTSQAISKAIREGKIGTPRVIYAEVNWGWIEAWHPNPGPFYQVGALWDVGVYPLTLASAFFGPATLVNSTPKLLKPHRVTKDGTPFTIEAPDWRVSIVDFEDDVTMRLTTSFYTGVSKQRGSLEIHGDAGTIRTESWQSFDAAVEISGRGGSWEEVAYEKGQFGVQWGRGIADLCDAIQNDRPHRATGTQAAHIVDILEACEQSGESGKSVAITSKFDRPAPLD